MTRDVKRGRRYREAVDLVMGLADFERSTHSPGHSRFHLERIGLLADLLGQPHADIPAVHIAGTKGKGSTAAMVTSILSAQGYRAGLYTSPHLHSVVERIRVGLDPVSKEEFAGLVEQVWPAVESVGREGGFGEVTTFEMLTAMAFQHFRAVGADVQVVEVGLGGRLDSTNILDPAVSVITSISLDHVVTLGGTLEEIASEKAGIIKPGRPVVSAPQRPEVLEVFRDTARRRRAPLVEVDAVMVRQAHHERTAIARGRCHTGQSATIRGLNGSYDVDLPLLGDHQLENAATAIATVDVETLADRGLPVSPSEAIVEGIGRVRWPGMFRLEVLSRAGPAVVVDGANAQSPLDGQARGGGATGDSQGSRPTGSWSYSAVWADTARRAWSRRCPSWTRWSSQSDRDIREPSPARRWRGWPLLPGWR